MQIPMKLLECLKPGWPAKCTSYNEILPSAYTVFRNDRSSRGGGVMLAIHNSISCQLLVSPKDIEIICVKLTLWHPIICCVIYIPPNSSSSYHETILSFLTDVYYDSSNNGAVHLLLLGDFNFTDIEWSTLSGQSQISQQFCDLIFDIGLDQLISLPTHIKGNTLDLLLTNTEDNIDSIKVHSDPLLFPPDHYSINFNLSFSKPSVKQTTYYCYKETTKDSMSICHIIAIFIQFSPIHLKCLMLTTYWSLQNT